jgi:hypothetical protein
MTHNKNKTMSTHNSETLGSIVIGFFLAVGNHIFGWLNHFFIFLSAGGILGDSIQAIITGMLGATAAYFTNKFWKFLEKRYKKPKNQD